MTTADVVKYMMEVDTMFFPVRKVASSPTVRLVGHADRERLFSAGNAPVSAHTNELVSMSSTPIEQSRAC